jgi:hypothetical protein
MGMNDVSSRGRKACGENRCHFAPAPSKALLPEPPEEVDEITNQIKQEELPDGQHRCRPPSEGV